MIPRCTKFINRAEAFLPFFHSVGRNSTKVTSSYEPQEQRRLCQHTDQIFSHHLHIHSQRRRHRSTQSSRTWLARQSKDPYVHRAQEENWPSRAAFKLEEINEIHFPSLAAKRKKRNNQHTNHVKNNKINDSNKRQTLIQPSMCVLDLGAAPGGWSLYASRQLDASQNGALVAVDLLPLDENLQMQSTDVSSRIMDNMSGNFEFVQGDFTQRVVRENILDVFSRFGENDAGGDSEGGSRAYPRADLVISDMAPNFTGDSMTDALRTLRLCEQAVGFAVGFECFDQSYSKIKQRHEGIDVGVLSPGGAFLCKYFSCGREN
ncbi:hypothetical protein ACHAXS_008248, partial [Conticribra weissflogii]